MNILQDFCCRPLAGRGLKQNFISDVRNSLLIVFLAAALLLPEAAMAATAPWDKTLKAIIDYINSGTARLIAVLVVMGVGFMALFGRISMQVVGSIVIGIILVFGSGAIADLLIGTTK